MVFSTLQATFRKILQVNTPINTHSKFLSILSLILQSTFPVYTPAKLQPTLQTKREYIPVKTPLNTIDIPINIPINTPVNLQSTLQLVKTLVNTLVNTPVNNPVNTPINTPVNTPVNI